MIEVVPAKPSHVNTIANRMRSIDRYECGVFGHSPKSALRQGLMSAAMAFTVLIDGRPEAMFGVTTISLFDSTGRPWLLMTDEGGKSRRALVRLGRLYTEGMQRHYSLLHNWVSAENDVTIRWLARLGYAIGGVEMIREHPMRAFIRCATPSR